MTLTQAQCSAYLGENHEQASLDLFQYNRGGVGKTSLIYHLARMYSILGKKVAIADLYPQANLTAAFLTEEKIETLWKEQQFGSTIYHCVKPLAGVGDIKWGRNRSGPISF